MDITEGMSTGVIILLVLTNIVTAFMTFKGKTVDSCNQLLVKRDENFIAREQAVTATMSAMFDQYEEQIQGLRSSIESYKNMIEKLEYKIVDLTEQNRILTNEVKDLKERMNDRGTCI